MSKLKRPALKTYFETGDIPTQGQFYDFIDSNLNLKEEGTEIANATISASGFIAENNITASGNIQVIGDINTSGTASFSGGITSDKIITNEVSSSISLLTIPSNITASGYISASSLEITSNANIVGTASIGFFAPGPISASGDISTGANLSVIGSITASSNISSSKDLEIRNISASGNISASQNIFAESAYINSAIYMSNNELVEYDGNTFNTFGGSPKPIVFHGASITINPHITASGNISASGTSLITAQDLNADRQLSATIIKNVNTTHITASGNISASGNITANKYIGLPSGLISSSESQLPGIVSSSGQIFHDETNGYSATRHIDHDGVGITAGAGLTGGGDITSTRTLAVGAGTGVTVNDNDVAIGQAVATTSNVSFAGLTLAKVTFDTIISTLGASPYDVGERISFTIPCVIPGLSGGAVTETQTVSANACRADSVVIGVTNHVVSVEILQVTDGSFRFRLVNSDSDSTIGAGGGQLNFVII